MPPMTPPTIAPVWLEEEEEDVLDDEDDEDDVVFSGGKLVVWKIF